MPETHYAFWLIPAEPWKTRLTGIIRDLVGEFDAPEVMPHVTFYHGPSTHDEARILIEKIAAQVAPVELAPERLGQSNAYAKTFFIQLRDKPMLRRMFEIAYSDVATPVRGYSLNPHLSLLYQNLNIEQREELCRRDSIPMEKMRFDTICAVEFETPWSEASARTYRVVVESQLRNL